jgi:YidC/Oxa1 family membrane protein insertase
MMEKRVILAIGLSALVFLAFSYYQQKYMPAKVSYQPAAQKAIQEAAEQPKQEAYKEAAAPAASATILPAADDTKASAQKITISGSLYRAVIDNRGAVLTSWQLKDYLFFKDDDRKQSSIFEMIPDKRSGETPSYPASMIFSDTAIGALANNEFYEVSVEGGSGNGSYAPPVTVVMTLKRGDLKIEKRFHFKKDNYIVDLSMTCEKNGKELEGQFFLGEDLGPEQEHLLSPTKLETVYCSGGKTRRESPPKDEKENKKIEGDVRWVGLDMQYFSIIAIPDRTLPYFYIQKHSIKTNGADGKEVGRDLIRTATPLTGSLKYQIYLGPKKQSNLMAVPSADLSDVINYGTFSILVIPLLSSLRWIYQYANNYGSAIIILTLILSLLLFPFRLKQIVSMKKMQAVQPKMNAIKEKYSRYKKTDPKRAEMNQEMMALYKEHGVNPLGGCIPLILQMPLLWAFYSLLANSIELRQAHFFGWLGDLSIKDPFYVLPIVMGITMFISQKMTPMAPGTDPTQAKMMMIMPVVFTIMFFNVSSGLNLYFLCSNIFQIALQKITEKWMVKLPIPSKWR